jgi:HD superfamily phosphohydrolase
LPHESLTAAAVLREPVKSLVAKCGADPQMTAAIVDDSLPESRTELHFYRRLLSGCLDPDKLDYLNRDARYCGVPYGMQDVDFILSRLAPSMERGADIDSRLIPNVEAVLFAKYLMYRTVYWHRQVRSCTAMIKKELLQALEKGEISGGQLYGLDDQSLFHLLMEKTEGRLAQAAWEGKPYSLAAEIPYTQADHACLKDITRRGECESRFAAEAESKGVHLAPCDIVIDLPEPISFETGLFVSDEGKNFSESSSALKGGVINSFAGTLYTVRVFVRPDSGWQIETFPHLCDILCNIKTWI